MKLSDGFSRLLPTVLIGVFYVASFSAMVMSLKRIELGVAMLHLSAGHAR